MEKILEKGFRKKVKVKFTKMIDVRSFPGEDFVFSYIASFPERSYTPHDEHFL